MSAGDVVAIAASVLLLVLALGFFYLFLKLGEVLGGITTTLHDLTRDTSGVLGGLQETVAGVNVELARVDTIVAGVQSITATTDSLVGVLHATVANPLVKAAAYAAGAATAVKGAKKVAEET